MTIRNDTVVQAAISEALAKAAGTADLFGPVRDNDVRLCRVCKFDEDRQLVFGWASISTVNGEMIVDKQGDMIPTDTLEDAAYDFALYHRRHGDMHDRLGTGRLVESMMFTLEKQQALGIDLGFEGWWVGFKVDDQAVWKRIKKGDLPEFSIGGKATREPVDKAFDPDESRNNKGQWTSSGSAGFSQHLQDAGFDEEHFKSVISDMKEKYKMKEMTKDDLRSVVQSYAGRVGNGVNTADRLFNSLESAFYERLYERDSKALADRATPV